MRVHCRRFAATLLLLTLISMVHAHRLLPGSTPAAAGPLLPGPDLALSVVCGPEANLPPGVVGCVFTVTNDSTMPVVTTQANPVTLDVSLVVNTPHTPTVVGALSGLCPYNTATTTQVGTTNLEIVTQQGTQNDLTLNQTGTTNIAIVSQVGPTNVLIPTQVSTVTTTANEAFHATCGGGTIAPGQSASYTVAVGACDDIPGGTATISAMLTPPAGATAVHNSFTSNFILSACTQTAAAASQPLPTYVPQPIPIATTGCGTTDPTTLPLVFEFGGAPTQVTAIPCPGHVFLGWTGGPCDGTRINPCNIPGGTTGVTANFSP